MPRAYEDLGLFQNCSSSYFTAEEWAQHLYQQVRDRNPEVYLKKVSTPRTRQLKAMKCADQFKTLVFSVKCEEELDKLAEASFLFAHARFAQDSDWV